MRDRQQVQSVLPYCLPARGPAGRMRGWRPSKPQSGEIKHFRLLRASQLRERSFPYPFISFETENQKSKVLPHTDSLLT